MILVAALLLSGVASSTASDCAYYRSPINGDAVEFSDGSAATLIHADGQTETCSAEVGEAVNLNCRPSDATDGEPLFGAFKGNDLMLNGIVYRCVAAILDLMGN